MKHSFFLIAIISLIFVSCAKESNENDSTISNYFSINGTKYDISKGYLADGGIWLLSNGISITGIVEGEVVLKGTGNAFIIREAGSVIPIVPGTYSFSSMEGGVVLNYNFITSAGDYFQLLPEGEGLCTINYTGLNYTIDTDGTLGDGNKLIVKYNGTLLNIIE
jgi:hypothetical protein